MKKALWTTLPNVNKAGQKVNPRREYIRQKKAFLKLHPVCAVWPWDGRKPRLAVDIHHVFGRLGPLLTDQRFWLAVSREAHDWIHINPIESRKLGCLCPVGCWNNHRKALVFLNGNDHYLLSDATPPL